MPESSDHPASVGDELRQVRLQKVEQLRASGVEPYTLRTPNRTPIGDLRDRFDKEKRTEEEAFVAAKKAHTEAKRGLSKEKLAELKEAGKKPEDEVGPAPEEPKRLCVAAAGRVRQARQSGKKLWFVDIVDQTGRIQLFLNFREVEEHWEVIQQLDLGDWVWAEGALGLTQTGELSIFAKKFRLLTKAIAPPPQNKAAMAAGEDAISDAETRQRQRYLDLMMNPVSRQRFEIRSRIIAGIRAYLDSECFLEVETPMMQPLWGGATARPFVTHHNTLHMDLFLRIAPELYLKRLLVGGMERVYEINRNFRNEGIDTQHNPEFTMLELYEAFGDYHRMMELTEGIYEASLRAAGLPDEIDYQGTKLDFSRPWPRLRWVDLFTEHVGVEWGDRKGMEKKVEEYKLDKKVLALPTDWLACELWEEAVEEHLVQPCFVIDYPTVISPLAKQREDDPEWVERFECFACQMELGNAFSELNDPEEQHRRFAEQVKAAIDRNDVELPREIDEDYVEALRYGMPPAGGLGVGIDRLIMLLTDTPTIRDVILFPQLKPRKAEEAPAT